MSVRRASAFAPGSVGNVAIGFDILGFAVDAVGDRVSIERVRRPGVTISAVRGIAGELPRDPAQNTAGRALLAMHEALGLDFGLNLEIDKGIPLGSGLGVRRPRPSPRWSRQTRFSGAHARNSSS